MAKNISIDVGFGFVKATDGTETIVFPSVIGEARNIRYNPGVSVQKSMIDNLVVEIDGEKFFVGSLANRQSEFTQATLSGDRTNSKEFKVLFLTACALLANNLEQQFTIVTGLPVNEFAEYKESLKESLARNHKMKLDDNSFNLAIQNVRVISQPFGTIFNILLDGRGDLRNKEYANMKIGVIDIGFRTTDFAVADSLEFVDKLSNSTTVALSTAYKLIARTLNEEFGIDKPFYQLDELIRSGYINYSGKQLDINDLVSKAFILTTQNIISEVGSLWSNLWEFDQIIITGGGSEHLYPYIKTHLDKLPLKLESQLSNAVGYQKLANRSFR